MIIDSNWYRIPTFECYDINVHDKRVRSSKHYKKDSFHIMQVINGKVTIVSDTGKPTRIKVDDLYELTFHSKYPLHPVGDYEFWVNTMNKTCRKLSSNVDIVNGTYTPIYAEPKSEFVLDFSKIVSSEPKRYKPFEINTKET